MISIVLLPSSLIPLLNSGSSLLKVHPDRISATVFLIGHSLTQDEGGVHDVRGKLYVHIFAEKLKALCGNYKEIITWLEENEIIQKYGSYSPGFSPCSYRFTDTALNDEFVQLQLEDKRTLQALNKLLEKQKKSISSKYPALKKWIFKEELKIPVNTKEKVFEKVYNSSLEQGNEEESVLLYTLGCRYKVLYTEQGRMWFFIDEFGNRLHSNLTNINRMIREGFRFRNEQLVEVDIKNSQPYFMLKGLLHHYSQEEIPADVFHFKQLVLTGELYSSFVALLKNSEGDDILERLTERQKQISSNSGKFKYGTRNYRDIRTPILPINNFNSVEPRDAGKALIFKILFGKHNLSTSDKQVFSTVFPNVWTYMGIIKSRNYKNLSMSLQRAESSVVLDTICKRISKEKRSLPIFTIHDCIVTLKGEELYVQNLMKEELTSYVGAPPTLRVKNYM